jgi:hypothetical protein
MFPEAPTIEFASQARRLAEGYHKACADMIRPGASAAELDRQVDALRATVGRSRGLRLDRTIRHIASDEQV